MSASAVAMFNAYTRPLIIRCASLSDRAGSAHAQVRNQPDGASSDGKSQGFDHRCWAAIHQQARACLRFERNEPKRPSGASELLQLRARPCCLPR